MYVEQEATLMPAKEWSWLVSVSQTEQKVQSNIPSLSLDGDNNSEELEVI